MKDLLSVGHLSSVDYLTVKRVYFWVLINTTDIAEEEDTAHSYLFRGCNIFTMLCAFNESLLMCELLRMKLDFIFFLPGVLNDCAPDAKK